MAYRHCLAGYLSCRSPKCLCGRQVAGRWVHVRQTPSCLKRPQLYHWNPWSDDSCYHWRFLSFPIKAGTTIIYSVNDRPRANGEANSGVCEKKVLAYFVASVSRNDGVSLEYIRLTYERSTLSGCAQSECLGLRLNTQQPYLRTFAWPASI